MKLKKSYTGVETTSLFESYQKINRFKNIYKSTAHLDTVPTLYEMVTILERCSHEKNKQALTFQLVVTCYESFEVEDHPLLISLLKSVGQLCRSNPFSTKDFFANNKLSEAENKDLMGLFISQYVNTNEIARMIDVFGTEKVYKIFYELIDKELKVDNSKQLMQYIKAITNSSVTKGDKTLNAETYRKYHTIIPQPHRGEFLSLIEKSILTKEDSEYLTIFKIKDRLSGWNSVMQIMKAENASRALVVDCLMELLCDGNVTLDEKTRDKLDAYDVLKQLEG